MLVKIEGQEGKDHPAAYGIDESAAKEDPELAREFCNNARRTT